MDETRAGVTDSLKAALKADLKVGTMEAETAASKAAKKVEKKETLMENELVRKTVDTMAVPKVASSECKTVALKAG